MVNSVSPETFLSENLHSFTSFNRVYMSDCGDDIACLVHDIKRTSVYPLPVYEPDFRTSKFWNSYLEKSSFRAKFLIWVPLVNLFKSGLFLSIHES